MAIIWMECICIHMGIVVVAIMMMMTTMKDDESAIEIIAKLDNWNPGIQRGKPVKVDLTVPVNFN